MLHTAGHYYNNQNMNDRAEVSEDQPPAPRQEQQQNVKEPRDSQPQSSNDVPNSNSRPPSMTPESIYDFYRQDVFPAIVSSFPILVHRIWTDVVAWIAFAAHELYLFILPTWWKEEMQRQQQVGDDGGGGGDSTGVANIVESYQSWLIETQKQLWDQAVATSDRVNATIGEFMLQHFDTNQDGHISASELLNMTELMQRLPQNANNVITKGPESFWMWFSREWPMMDWKLGVFLWQTFGGLILVIAVLSIVPGRLHAWSGKILRWPILGFTYLLVSVELVVYIVIRVAIRIAETIFATPKHRALRRKMANAKSYEEWYQYAAALDLSQKRDKWQRTIADSSSYQYNWPLIQQLMADMREARQKQDVILALAVLQQCTRKNVGGIMSEDLFSKTYTGEPKFIVIEFIGEVTKTLHWVTDRVMSVDASLEKAENGNDDEMAEKTRSLDDMENYEKSFKQKSHHEREHLWQSIIGLAINVATLNFNPSDNDEKKKEKKKLKESSKSRSSSKVASSPKELKDGIEKLNAATIGSPSRANPSFTDMDEVDVSYASSGDLTSVVSDVGSEGAQSVRSSGSIPTTAHREQLLVFLKRARAIYGRTALCLSGGAMMGLYHFGHLQGLMETDCMPNIVSGCSAGSVIGAVVCTRTNDELLHDLDPEVIGPKMKCFDRTWTECIRSLWKTGNLFDEKDWQQMIQWFTCGDMTFEEAYHKTGRIFCIALSATSKKTPPILLNHISAPNVTLASAVVASAAVPGFVNPQQLKIKDADGTIRFAGPEKYFDGSIRHDIPTAGLSEMLNCQFFVAAQCNPHIVPFFFDPKGGVGRPSRWSGGDRESSWRGGFLLSALEMYLKNDMKAKFVFLRDLDAAVSFTGTMLTQSFEGSTTVVPRVRLRDFFTLFSDPSVESLYHYNQAGSVAAYQHAAMIRLHYRLADALDVCIEKLELGRKEQSRSNDSFQIKVNRRASFDTNKKICRAMAHMEAPRASQHMPDIIAAALLERMEQDSTSLSDGSTN